MENKRTTAELIDAEFKKYAGTINLATDGPMGQLVWSAYSYGVGVGLQLAVDAIRVAPPKGGTT